MIAKNYHFLRSSPNFSFGLNFSEIIALTILLCFTNLFRLGFFYTLAYSLTLISLMKLIPVRSITNYFAFKISRSILIKHINWHIYDSYTNTKN